MFDRIVVGTDGSETADKAVRQATELAKAVGVVDRSRQRLRAGLQRSGCARRRSRSPTDMEWMVNPREDVDATLKAAAEQIEEAGRRGPYARPRGRSGRRDPRRRRGAEADLIIVGNKGMTGAKRFLLGSVPNKVSHHAPCCVLIIRTT